MAYEKEYYKCVQCHKEMIGWELYNHGLYHNYCENKDCQNYGLLQAKIIKIDE